MARIHDARPRPTIGVPCPGHHWKEHRRLMVQASTSAALPLSGIRLLDLTLARAGPTCARHLADSAADLIRVEPPNQTKDAAAPPHAFTCHTRHRNTSHTPLDVN